MSRRHLPIPTWQPAMHCPQPLLTIRQTVMSIWSLGDRKSTRLNSSHTVISYAVFCLKKKKAQDKWTDESLQSATFIHGATIFAQRPPPGNERASPPASAPKTKTTARSMTRDDLSGLR